MWAILGRLLSNEFSMSNPTELQLADLWLQLPRVLLVSSFIAIAMFMLTAAAAMLLVVVSSHHTKKSITKGLKVILCTLLFWNVFILWFGPSLSCYRRIVETVVSGTPMYRVDAEVSDAQEFKRSGRSSSRLPRYLVTLRTPGPDTRLETYDATYDTYTQAKIDTRIGLACFSSRTCWIAYDFRDFRSYLWAISLISLLNLCLLIGICYLLWHWRLEP